ncbi:MAG: DUF2188 domain-containing protein [Candidatus Methanomethylophilaceae archaeon]|jgi:hypothetical protein
MSKDDNKKSNTKIYRVTPDKERNKWRIKADGAERAIGYYNTKAEALKKAKELKSKNADAKISVHGKDGKIQEYI